MGDFGRYWEGQNCDRIFEKTRVGFGRTELSLRLSCTVFCALSSGQVPGVWVFMGGSSGMDFCIFFRRCLGVESDKLGKVFLQKLGSDLVVQSSR